MNNAMEIAVVNILSNIPKEILEYAFMSREPYESTIPLEEMIINKVIRWRVLKEINVFGGKTTKVVLHEKYLEDLKFTQTDHYTRTGPFSLYRIPPEERELCPIVEIHNLTYCGNYAGHYPNATGWSGGQNALSLGQAVLDAHTFASYPPKPVAELLSGDLVKLTPSQHAQVGWLMECRISYDENVTNMASSSIDTFAQMCVAATKSYLYNKLLISVNKAYVEGGYELSEWKMTLDKYSDAEERYQELKKELAGSEMVSPDRCLTLLRYML